MNPLKLKCRLSTPTAPNENGERGSELSWITLTLDRTQLTSKAIALVEILGSISASIPDHRSRRDEILIRSVQTRREMMNGWTPERREAQEHQAAMFGINLDEYDEATFSNFAPLRANPDGTYDAHLYIERMAGRIPLGYIPIKRLGTATDPGTTTHAHQAIEQAAKELTELLTTREVCALANIKPATWRAYAARGQAPAPTLYRERTPLWAKPDIDQWLANRTNKDA